MVHGVPESVTDHLQAKNEWLYTQGIRNFPLGSGSVSKWSCFHSNHWRGRALISMSGTGLFHITGHNALNCSSPRRPPPNRPQSGSSFSILALFFEVNDFSCRPFSYIPWSSVNFPLHSSVPGHLTVTGQIVSRRGPLFPGRGTKIALGWSYWSGHSLKLKTGQL